jgi:hypothetical protein
MRKPLLNRRRQDLVTGVLLVMLVFRAYVPPGFMPASGTPFLLQLCPAVSPVPVQPMLVDMSMPMDMPMPAAHHHHPGTHANFEHCPFGSAPAAGPISHAVVFNPAGPIGTQAAAAFESLQFTQRFQRAHQPRGPPSFA